MESFYGGINGAPFVIAKTFDQISPIRDGDNKYEIGCYAIEGEGFKIVEDSSLDGAVYIAPGKFLIEQQIENYSDYTWKKQPKDGSIIPGTSYNFPVGELLESMEDCFIQGIATTDIVNYGEYVLIDTLKRLHSRNNLNNGKVFRRGLDNTAEYIGQIVGPQGDTPEFEITNISDKRLPSKSSFLSFDNEGLVPGYDSSTGEYTDNIEYKTLNIKDASGDIKKVLLGFKIPYLIQDFTAKQISPYDIDEEENLIIPDSEQFDEETKWKHNFYRKWNLKVPKGIHGTDSYIDIIPLKTMPRFFKSFEFQGAELYEDIECTISKGLYSSNSLDIDGYYFKDKENGTKELKSVSVIYNEEECYVKVEDCYMDIAISTNIDYSENEEGKKITTSVPYNVIKNMEMDTSGKIYCSFSCIENRVAINELNPIKFVKTIECDSVGTVIIKYNTGESDTYTNAITVVTNVQIDNNGKINVFYSNRSTDDIGYLNIIKETIISMPTDEYPNVPYSHLLVYFSDPEYRLNYIKGDTSKFIKYKCLTGDDGITEYTEWIDLGPVKGEAGGLHIIRHFSNSEDFKEYESTPPEQIPFKIGEEIISNCPGHAGWCCTIQRDEDPTNIHFIAFDYYENRWYDIGNIDTSTIDAESIFIIDSAKEGDPSKPNTNPAILAKHGMWFVIEPK